jgi:hypothetical protein
MCLGRSLKFIGFIINILASLWLIHGALFRWPDASFWDFFSGKTKKSLLQYIREALKREWAPRYTTRDLLLTSSFVIIGSSLQMAGDLLDP